MRKTDDGLTHINDNGAATMVDVASKSVTHRVATASARISMSSDALNAIRSNSLKKGEAIGTARIAGIMASKKVADLIPLCHNIPISSVDIEIEYEQQGLVITAKVSTDAKTGVEMEALTACTISALTIYDMAKSLDRSMTISDVRLISKSGGRSGDYPYEEKQ